MVRELDGAGTQVCVLGFRVRVLRAALRNFAVCSTDLGNACQPGWLSVQRSLLRRVRCRPLLCWALVVVLLRLQTVEVVPFGGHASPAHLRL